MSYSNGLLSDQSYQTANKYVQRGLPGVGFKLTDMGDYDMQNKNLVNVDEGENNQDVVNKHQLDVGLQTKPNKTDVLLLDGTSHMVGDLDLRGNKIILPGEIQMDRKLITNLDTDENQDLSAVNMITLKNKVEPKADKDYVDFEITKQNALINNTFVKKTGDQMNGDLILPHDSYPVEGNTNKAISYETQREIFLSRRESFPMQADINMNNNFIQNIATPTSSHQVTNKGYCDYNFLNRQKGGVLMGPLSMNRNDLFEIPAPKYGNSAVNKNYVDTEITKVHQNIDLTPFLRKDGLRAMTGSLNMNGNQIIRLKEPVSSSDAATKSYIDSTLANSHLKSSHGKNEFKYLDDPSETSSEYNITIEAFTDFNQSPHRNKKAFQVSLQKDVGTNNYRSRMGFNLFPLPLGRYTMIFEHFPPVMTNIQLSCQATTAYVHRQVQKDFTDYSKLLVQINNNSKSTPDYIFFTIHGTAVVSNPQGHIIVYGVKDWSDSIDPSVYDYEVYSQMFKYENGDMQMQTNINTNNHKITNLNKGINDTDAVNKLQLDSVSFYTNNHTYRDIFHETFYDLIETSTFNINKNSFGVVILGVKPNLYLGTNRYLSNYDRIHGMQLSNGHLLLKNNINQNTSFTLFLSIYFSEDIEIKFAGDLVTNNGYYPSYSISNNRLGIIESSSISYHAPIIGDFKNKKIMLWICHNASNNLYKFTISNSSSHIQNIISNPMNFSTKILRILYSGYLNKIGFIERFIDIDSLDHHRVILEEMRNGSYFE